MLPAGMIQRIDANDERVWANRTKDQIKDAPEYDPSSLADGYYGDLGGYYDEGGHGHRGWD